MAASLGLQPTAAVTTGDRLIVQVGVWSYGKATASGVTDSAGNTYTKLTSVKASDDTELSVWSAPITAGGGTRPTVTVTTTASADIGASVLEYSGLSTAAGTGVVDVLKTATGTTSAAGNVSSGATAASTAAGELAMGFYADSGFGNALTGDPTYTVRTNVSPTGDMELLAQDRVLTATGTTANPTTRTGASTPWLAATLVLKSAAPPAGGAAVQAQARSVALTARTADSSSAATQLSAATAAQPITDVPVQADKLVYAFTAVAPAQSKSDPATLLFCPLNFLTIGKS